MRCPNYRFCFKSNINRACYPSVRAAFIFNVTIVLFRCLLFEFQSFHNYLDRSVKR